MNVQLSARESSTPAACYSAISALRSSWGIASSHAASTRRRHHPRPAPDRRARPIPRHLAIFVAALFIGTWNLPSIALAQNGGTSLSVATFIIPPFVMQNNGGLTGFSIDLWHEIANRLKIKSDFVIDADVTALFENLRSKKSDLAVSGIFITADRDKEFDFSYPILDAGLQIMVRESGNAAAIYPASDLFRQLFSVTSVVWLGSAIVFMLIPAHVIWFIERRRSGGIVPTRRYFPGIFYAMFWSTSTLMGQAEQVPRHGLARGLALFWMFAGVVFVALYTAQLTATLTVRQIRGAIEGPDDLPGRTVGTLAASSSVGWLREHGASVAEYPQTADMFKALLDKKVEALLLGAPVLRYYAAHEGSGLVKMVGSEFSRGELGIVLPLDSGLRRPINAALLEMREDGTYQRIYDNWFGAEN
jgi:polar amino acid transport system substrate-binding protein